jgi:hypothetical protein
MGDLRTSCDFYFFLVFLSAMTMTRIFVCSDNPPSDTIEAGFPVMDIIIAVAKLPTGGMVKPSYNNSNA